MGAGIGEKHRESVREQKLRISSHAQAIIAESMKKEDRIAIGQRRPHELATENRRVGSCDGDVLHNGVQGLNPPSEGCRVLWCEAAARRMQGSIGKNDAANGTEGEIQEQPEDEPAEAAVSCHILIDDTGRKPCWFRLSAELKIEYRCFATAR